MRREQGNERNLKEKGKKRKDTEKGKNNAKGNSKGKKGA
jgi:hypothetical protein